jgi:UDP-N-acetylglucosamine 4-epimerase
MNEYELVLKTLASKRYTWLITGVAGFIGSNILEKLLKLDQNVVGLDNYATGHETNLLDVKGEVSQSQWARFRFIEGDITDAEVCRNACKGADFVLHQAALGSVPRSIADPIATNNANVNGFLNMLSAAKDQNVKSFTYAASSSTYGDHPDLPKSEKVTGNPLSPYAVTKLVNELYSNVFSKVYGFHSTGLRYFNVFGKRQDPNGAYAAVIPKWINALANNQDITINGDGETSRDFCFVENAVQANILAAMTPKISASRVFNVAYGDRTTLNQLFTMLKSMSKIEGMLYEKSPIYLDFRPGDVKHSLADIAQISHDLGYKPLYSIKEGLSKALPWYRQSLVNFIKDGNIA